MSKISRKARKAKEAKKTELRVLAAMNSLIGARLISISDSQIVCKKGDETITISVCTEEDSIDHWEVTSTLLISEGDFRDNPVITKVEQNGDTFEFVLFGAYRPLAKIEAEFHNYSQWDYGCTCQIFIDETEVACWWG